MRVRCKSTEYSHVNYGIEYIVSRIENERYHFAHVPTDYGYPFNHFEIVSLTDCDTTNDQPKLVSMEERVAKLEATLRQMQDQLDNHNHIDKIDFTVERETK